MPDQTQTPDDRRPVIVGIGEITDRPTDIAQGLEPLDLLEAALKRAADDAGAALLSQIDSLDIVNFLSWRYDAPEQLLAARLGAKPTHNYYGPVGGESPIRYLHEAAQRIARGESKVAAICGAESQGTATKAARAKIDLPWTPFAHHVEEPKRGAAFQKPLAVALGVFRPVTVYPLYESATSAHWGQTPRDAMAESGELWARYSAVAATNPQSWMKRSVSAETIATPSPDNRLIAWPYPKLMVANPTVNMGGALIMTSLAYARALGIPDAKMIHIHGGASAEEKRDYLDRDQFVESHAQNAVLRSVMDLVGGDGRAFDAIELYSCFPVVPKMARRTLGLGDDVMPTVTGGLTFFGAPLNTYMTHAACAMVRKLRDGAKLGLLYGQGGFVTKHHALVLSRHAPTQPLSQDTSVQAVADAARHPVPAFDAAPSGRGKVEAFTVLYGANAAPEHGVVMLRTETNARTLARVPASDVATLRHLMEMDRTPVGSTGVISTAADDVPQWRVGT
ncbi:MAG: acetyl-CoA acetyltransferase [Tardiphaga sp.]|nr:acetyl-CoA acetyltransferase [Tardiphaga sp.]